MSEPLLSVRDLHVWFPTPQGTVRAVNGVDLDVLPGETHALVGESGCGKSTLARAIVGLTPLRQGRVEYRSQPIGPLGTRARTKLCREIQMIFQDPAASLNPRMTLASAIAEPLRVHGLVAPRDLDQEVCSVLEKVGIDPAMRNRYPHELSGGQRQRVSIARALAVRPTFIICDEAVSALDVSIQAQILNLLQRLQETEGLTYLFITHDLSVVRHLADRVSVMYLGKVVEQDDCDALFRAPAHPYCQLLLSAAPSITHAKRPELVPGELPSPLDPPRGCAFHPRCPKAWDKCRGEQPALYPSGPHGLSRCYLSAPEDPNS